MNSRWNSNPRATLAGLAAGLSAVLAGAAMGQTPPPATATPARATEFRSALEGYQPYTEEKTLSWKDANDTTARIGGWRAYAKEAQQGAAPDVAGQADPYAGHGKPAQAKP